MKHTCIKCKSFYWKSKKKVFTSLLGAHPDAINGVVFINNTTLASAGQDGVIKIWEVNYAD